MTVTQNISRLRYLLKLYQLSEDELLGILNDSVTKKLRKEEIFSENINIDYLKRIDKIFNKGLSYYVNPEIPEEKKEASIFFRKKSFHTPLNLETRKRVNEFEDIKMNLSIIAKLSNINLDRQLPVLLITDDPKIAAIQVRNIIQPKFQQLPKDFLKHLINKLAEQNIFVFEFIETWNKNDTVNIDGFYLNPNFIVLKRQSPPYRREIFTLLHEFGHYLLNIEDIEELDYGLTSKSKTDKVEQWCNDFAFYFLIADYEQEFNSLTKADTSNNYNLPEIEIISKKTHLSRTALLTRTLISNKISYPLYKSIVDRWGEEYRKTQEKVKQQRELEKKEGIVRPAQPIKSDLLISTIQRAYYEGVIDEFQVCETLKIKPEKIDTYIQ